ncbi:MAG: tRNA pseudouridine(55) synthase TruB [Acidobacteriia bacterium]|nr:tRNA pseudouridine(55) synthase TruB [Terriglobia bacterium]
MADTKFGLTLKKLMPDGVVVIDKTRGVTSHDVVDRVRRITGHTRVGHFGTLDPMATGVLPVALGGATRLQQFYLGSRKVYSGTIRFGFSTSTYDSEGRPSSEEKIVSILAKELEEVRGQFVGPIQQTPPAFSAKKIRGVSSHRLARKNQPVELKPIQVEVYRFDLSLISPGEAEFEVECSGGTYVRSLAHEMGLKLGCGAHLTSLRRLASGEFTLGQALDFNLLTREPEGDSPPVVWMSHMIPINKLLSWMASVYVPDEDLRRVKHGMTIRVEGKQIIAEGLTLTASPAPCWVRLLNGADDLIGMGRVDFSNSRDDLWEIKPKIVFSSA